MLFPSRLRILYMSHFSAQASSTVQVVYFFILGLIVFYSVLVMIEGVTDICSYPNRRREVEDDISYTNPEFTTRGHCLQTRYAILFGLTPQECSLCRRILLSVFLGMLIGFERRRPDRPAGVRTMSLVSLGSCIFTIDSMFAFSSSPDSWDSSRVAAAIPSGVGFLGAGLIYKNKIQDRHEVHGLTTASSVWLSAAAGIAAGGGLVVIALFSTLVMVVVLRFGPRLGPDDDGAQSQASDASDNEERYKAVEDANDKKTSEMMALVESGADREEIRDLYRRDYDTLKRSSSTVSIGGGGGRGSTKQATSSTRARPSLLE